MLIIGLGNPGNEYINTRHNVGFMLVDAIASSLGLSWQNKFDGEFASTNYQGKKIFLLKPHTYMNLSGKSAIAAKNYYKIDLSDIVVFQDELDIDFASIKHKVGGGSGGHNGIKSLDSSMGKDYHRIRVGIGRPTGGMDPSDYVLSKFSKEEQIEMDEIIADITHNFDMIIAGEFDKFAAKFKK